MKLPLPSLTRRTLLGAAATSLFVPVATLAQKKNMKIRIKFADHDFTASLNDTASAKDLLTMLPLDIKVEDYSNNEKIAYLPRKLTEKGSGPFESEKPGDLCYYAPWGNLVFFYDDYHYSPGLIRLGRLDGDIKPLMTRGEFPIHIEKVS